MGAISRVVFAATCGWVAGTAVGLKLAGEGDVKERICSAARDVLRDILPAQRDMIEREYIPACHEAYPYTITFWCGVAGGAAGLLLGIGREICCNR